MRAVIMAGGEGTRLRPLTCDKPKPMVSVMGIPVMQHIINLLKSHGITEIAVTLQYMPQEIINYFRNGEDFGVSISYYTENTPLGTAGSVKNAEEFLTDDFLIISGDAITDINLTEAIEFHKTNKSVATLVLYKVAKPLEYGVVVTDSNNRITRFLEKPDFSEILSDMANTGIYILNPKVLNLFAKDEFYDFAKDLFPKLLKNGEPMFGYPAQGYWCDIGDTDAYIRCHYDILDKKVNIQLPKPNSGGSFIEEGAVIEEGSVIHSPVYICSGARIQSGAECEQYSVIGRNTLVRRGASVKRGILWDNINVGLETQIRGAVLCDRVVMGDGSSVYENSVLGMGTNVGARAVIEPNIKIWPYKTIEDGAMVKDNMVWGSRVAQKLFCERGICGEINVDITPEFATKLGAAFGALIKTGKVGVGYEAHPSADMLSGAVISGLLSSGVQVYTFGEQVLPITRSAVRFYGLDGGIHLSISKTDDKQSLSIEFLDRLGANIIRDSERKLEGIFIREDFVRCEPENIKELMEVKNYKYYYLRDLINGIKSKKITCNMQFTTKSDTVAELLGLVIAELESKIAKDVGVKQFSVHVSDNGEGVAILDKNGGKLSTEQFLALSILITLKNRPDSTVVMPISASWGLSDMVNNLGGKVVYSKTSDSDFMKEMLVNGATEQFKMCYDGIYAAIRILDFINLHNMSLTQILEEIPSFYKREVEVECSDMYKGQLIKELINQYKDEKIELKEGIKIYKNNGWTLIIPHNHRNVCRIISEGPDMETADELTNIFEKEVKRLAKI